MNKQWLTNYIKENEPKEEIMELNKIDKSKCQWAWVGDQENHVIERKYRRLAVSMFGEKVLCVNAEEEEDFYNDGNFNLFTYDFYELIKEPKTKTVPMNFEDILCIPCENDCVVVFRYKSTGEMYLNATITDCCESLVETYEYSIFNKSTKTYSEWLPLTKTVEVEE